MDIVQAGAGCTVLSHTGNDLSGGGSGVQECTSVPHSECRAVRGWKVPLLHAQCH